MWLERFSAQPPPSTSSPPRHHSSSSKAPLGGATHLVPAPPRPSLNSPYSSSLSIASVVSTSVPPATVRLQNGSGLRNQVRNGPSIEIEDPLSNLERIIGTPLKKDISTKENGKKVKLFQKPSEPAEDVDFGGLSLQEFVDHNNVRSNVSANVPPYSEHSIEEYEKQRRKFEDLHKSIVACDDVLKSVDNYLTSFQSDLGAVSAEIETLQSRSTHLNSKLENRKKVEKLLGPVVEEITISPAVVRKISEGPIDDGWAQALEELQARSKSMDTGETGSQKVRALEDLEPLIENLSDRAVERIRDYFVSQIKALRSPNINAQVIQQQALLSHASLYTFLGQRQPKLADDFGQAYSNTMRWYYSSLFTRYHAALTKLRLHSTEQHSTLGDMSATSSRVPPSYDAFNLARRADVLRNPTITALPSHVAEDSKAQHFLETSFLSFNIALIDNASFEYTFLTTFFSPFSNTQKLSRQFTSIFDPTFSLGTALTKSLIADSHDALGILLLVRLTQHFAFALQRRKVPTLEAYINATSMLLWPRFQLVLDAHCDSLKRLTASLPNRPGTGSALASLGGGGSSGGSQSSTAPHPVTQRFANLTRGILVLSSEAGDDEPVSYSLARLRGEFEAFLTKMGAQFGAGEKGRREKERFLANNYSLVLTILMDAKGRLAEEMREHFEASRGVLGTGKLSAG